MAPRFGDHPGHARQIVAAAVAAVEPEAAVRRYLQRQGETLLAGGRPYKLAEGRLFLVGAGKAAAAMGRAVAAVAGEALTAGVLIAKGEAGEPAWPAQAVRLYEAGHPLPDERGMAATVELVALVSGLEATDLVIFALSGGASALLTQPALPLAQWQWLVAQLLASGCTINELNAVRRQLDRVKGGGLAEMIAPARCLTLVLSDVVGNPLAAIGSGPTTAREPGEAEVALDLLQRSGVAKRLGAAGWQTIVAIVEERAARPVADAQRGQHIIVGDVRQATEAAVAEAAALGFKAELLTAHLQGEAREVGRVVAALAKELAPGRCLALGGETTVTIGGPAGEGGRNQELALAAAIELEGWENTVVMAAATDGEDGPTPAAGAVIHGGTVAAARRLGLAPLEYLAKHDSHAFFRQAGGLIGDGPTGTNTNDIVVVLKYG
jgi:hydroxypyruvate reductase